MRSRGVGWREVFEVFGYGYRQETAGWSLLVSNITLKLSVFQACYRTRATERCFVGQPARRVPFPWFLCVRRSTPRRRVISYLRWRPVSGVNIDRSNLKNECVISLEARSFCRSFTQRSAINPQWHLFKYTHRISTVSFLRTRKYFLQK